MVIYLDKLLRWVHRRSKGISSKIKRLAFGCTTFKKEKSFIVDANVITIIKVTQLKSGLLDFSRTRVL